MLKIKGLECGYGRKRVLNGITVDISCGEIAGIAGPNGCGKTTLLKAVTKVIRPYAGIVYLKGKDLRDMTCRDVSQVAAFVPQDINIISAGISVGEYVLLGRMPHRKRFQFMETDADMGIAFKAMEMTGIIDKRNEAVCALSGGERQRTFISRALAQEPELLLLDEPAAWLDIRHQYELFRILKKLNREQGVTVLVVLHDLNLASALCGRIIVMKEGRIYAEGGVEDVLTAGNIQDVFGVSAVVEHGSVTGARFVRTMTGLLSE